MLSYIVGNTTTLQSPDIGRGGTEGHVRHASLLFLLFSTCDENCVDL